MQDFHMLMGFRVAIMAAVLLVVAIIGFINPNAELLSFILPLCSAFFGIALGFWLIGMHRQRMLARLQTQGTAYDADNVDYASANMLNMTFLRDHLAFRAYFSYTDKSGDTHTTGTRWYALRLDKTETYLTPLDNFTFTARVYVNPDNTRDYSVELYVEE